MYLSRRRGYGDLSPNQRQLSSTVSGCGEVTEAYAIHAMIFDVPDPGKAAADSLSCLAT